MDLSKLANVDPVIGLSVAVAALVVVTIGLGIALLRCERSRRAALASRAAALEAHQSVAELAAKSERLRIVREMHDVIAHSLAIMIAQADGGTFVSSDPEAAQRAFTTIAETGRGALTDTRRILGILKDDTEESPTLALSLDAGLAGLVDQYRQSGLGISLIRTGDPQQLPAAARTALHRIAQESLANVVKHAGSDATVVIAQAWQDDQVSLTITSSGGRHATATDPLTGEPLPGRGLGVIGMQERAELLGGSLHAGPTEAGYQVRALIPRRLEEDA